MHLQIPIFREKLLDWYDSQARALPWRVPANTSPDPYKIWLSEVMLQQTTVQAVIPYYLKFLAKWPTIQDLAAASQDDVNREWAGLGYYSRARNLLACAKEIVAQGGIFPRNGEGLQALPGIGPYTAAAIASIAYNIPANAADGNVERVMARYFAIETPYPEGKKLARDHAESFIGDYEGRHGDYTQALMELGATICRPKTPLCGECPVREGCTAYQAGTQNDYPKRSPKKALPHKSAYVFLILDGKGNIYTEKRPEKGMVGGMIGFPCTEWDEIGIKKQEIPH
ncbi:MAG: A/G-specific adenine glycosylase, partial [Pseudobdellovibrionaceae bacterium]